MAKWKENLEVCQKSPGALIQAPSNPLRIKGIIELPLDFMAEL